MNIVFCYITPFHPKKGGVGRVTDSLARELQARGHKVFYLIYVSGITIKHEFDYPAPLIYMPSTDLLSNENLEFYHDFLRKHDIDIIVNQSGNFSDSQLWLNKGDSKAKLVSVLHTYPSTSIRHLWHCDIYPLRNNTVKEKIKRIARILLYPKIKRERMQRLKAEFNRFLPKTDVVVALTSNIMNELDALCPGYRAKYRFIPNCNSYDAGCTDTHYEKKKQVLFVGLFGSVKREDLMVRIWKRICFKHPDWELLIVGYGDDRRTARLRRIAAKCCNVKILGFQDPYPYQQDASIACMTSISEGWPLVLSEAMQCGAVPVVFNSFASASEIIQDGFNGLLVRPFRIKEYAEKLDALMDNPATLSQMSMNSKATAKKYEVAKVVDQWEELFAELDSPHIKTDEM